VAETRRQIVPAALPENDQTPSVAEEKPLTANAKQIISVRRATPVN
jgi:hypothetical protein